MVPGRSMVLDTRASQRDLVFFPFFSLLLLKKCGHLVMKEREKRMYNNAAVTARVML